MKFTDKTKEFFKEVYVEMRRVSWLSRKEIVKYTLIVLGFTIISAAFLGGLDYIFTLVIKSFLLK
jgi:preprotein translocase subunit SecE